jgi:hypothetical protein
MKTNQFKGRNSALVILAVFLFFCQWTFSQTAVRMKLPQQSEEPLSIAVLYEEPVQAGTIIVMAAFGYYISGGTSPYTLNWMKDNQVIATGDIAVITPVAGSAYSLKITDKHNCTVTQSININTQNKIRKEILSDGIIIAPSLVTDHITVGFTGNSLSIARIRILDVIGKLRMETSVQGNSIVPVNLPKGNYFVVVEKDELYTLKKIIVQ